MLYRNIRFNTLNKDVIRNDSGKHQDMYGDILDNLPMKGGYKERFCINPEKGRKQETFGIS
jgi:hypothetical protein